jgi:predicted DNA-binding transcriptional regulator YafY
MSDTLRTLNILRLINNHPSGLTLKEIHERLHAAGDKVSLRQLSRYPEMLGSLGIDVVMLDGIGKAKRYRVENFFKSKPALSTLETMAVFLAVKGMHIESKLQVQVILKQLMGGELLEEFENFFVIEDSSSLSNSLSDENLDRLQKVFQTYTDHSVMQVSIDGKPLLARPVKVTVCCDGIFVEIEVLRGERDLRVVSIEKLK